VGSIYSFVFSFLQFLCLFLSSILLVLPFFDFFVSSCLQSLCLFLSSIPLSLHFFDYLYSPFFCLFKKNKGYKVHSSYWTNVSSYKTCPRSLRNSLYNIWGIIQTYIRWYYSILVDMYFTSIARPSYIFRSNKCVCQKVPSNKIEYAEFWSNRYSVCWFAVDSKFKLVYVYMYSSLCIYLPIYSL